MFDLGIQELIVIFVVALLVFGPKRLPELARNMGKGVAELKKAMFDIRHEIDKEVGSVPDLGLDDLSLHTGDLKKAIQEKAMEAAGLGDLNDKADADEPASDQGKAPDETEGAPPPEQSADSSDDDPEPDEPVIQDKLEAFDDPYEKLKAEEPATLYEDEDDDDEVSEANEENEEGEKNALGGQGD